MPNFIRTYMLYVVGWIVTLLSMIGITVDDDQKAFIVLVIFTLAGAIWHAIVRTLEKKWPKLSILLGSKKQPVYIDGTSTVIKTEVAN